MSNLPRGKVVANRGLARNKRPLQNKLLWFEELKDGRFWTHWAYEREYNRGGVRSLDMTPITLDDIKARLTPNQWCKFRQGERHFVEQRRIDGKNVPIKE